MVDVIKLLGYNKYLREEYLDCLEKLPWEEIVKDKSGSFGSIRNIYLHCIIVIEYILTLLQKDASIQRLNYDYYDNIEKIRKYVELVDSKFGTYLSSVKSGELERKIERKHSDGSKTISTVEDTLFDLFQEETHHLGELIALLWQMNITPPHLSWIRYLKLKG